MQKKKNITQNHFDEINSVLINSSSAIKTNMKDLKNKRPHRTQQLLAAATIAGLFHLLLEKSFSKKIILIQT